MIIQKMVQLIGAIETEAANLMVSIKKYKRQKTKGQVDSDEEDPPVKSKGSVVRHKTSNSIEMIGCLENEIRQICHRISSLNQRVNADSEEAEEDEP